MGVDSNAKDKRINHMGGEEWRNISLTTLIYFSTLEKWTRPCDSPFNSPTILPSSLSTQQFCHPGLPLHFSHSTRKPLFEFLSFNLSFIRYERWMQQLQGSLFQSEVQIHWGWTTPRRQKSLLLFFRWPRLHVARSIPPFSCRSTRGCGMYPIWGRPDSPTGLAQATKLG